MELEAYLKVDRQWHRNLRLAHARYQLGRALGRARDKHECDFWTDVLERNTQQDE
jgi:hypothetical protein